MYVRNIINVCGWGVGICARVDVTDHWREGFSLHDHRQTSYHPSCSAFLHEHQREGSQTLMYTYKLMQTHTNLCEATCTCVHVHNYSIKHYQDKN